MVVAGKERSLSDPASPTAVLHGTARTPTAETSLAAFWVVLHFEGSFASLYPAAGVLPSSRLQNTGSVWLKRAWVSPFKWPV